MEARIPSPARTLREMRAAFAGAGALDSPRPADELVEALAEAIGRRTAPGFTCTMNGGALTTTYEGVEGLRSGWQDFLAGFETLQISPEEIRDGADGKTAVEFVRLIGTPRGARGEVEQNAAAVWRLGDGGVEAVEFYLDRAAALRAGGLDPAAPGPPAVAPPGD
jgi:ketosteroid isomerase-like protein